MNLNLKNNIEAQARAGRYQAFQSVIQKGEALVLAHHLDDQLETFLLNAIRGTGITGLASMPLYRNMEGIDILRPFLDTPRASIKEYAQKQHLTWVEDESNQSIEYSRNFLRHEIFPKIEKLMPHYRQSMLHTVMSCQESYDYLEQHVTDFVSDEKLKQTKLSTTLLKSVNQEQRCLVLRKWLHTQGVKSISRVIINEIITQMLDIKRLDSTPKIKCGDINLHYYQGDIYCLAEPEQMDVGVWTDFPNPFLGLEAVSASNGIAIDPKQDKVEVRYRVGGEIIFYKGHHRELKKLLQAAKVPHFVRNQIPLIYVNDELKSIVGYWNADMNDYTKNHYQIQFKSS